MDAGYFEGVKKFLRVGTVQKELVDPFCIVTFAGHKGKTEVIWNEQDPEWNQQINLGVRVCGGGGLRIRYYTGGDFKEWYFFYLQFPSMCERLRFQVKDR